MRGKTGEDLSRRGGLPRRDDSPQNASAVLAIDVGAGTQDILLWEPGKPIENCVQLVLPSQTVVVGRRIAALTAERKDICLTGYTMGGGPSTLAARRHIGAGFKVFATLPAAKTIRDNPEEVAAMGVQLVDKPPAGTVMVEMADVDRGALSEALARFEVRVPEQIAVAVQDHGETLTGSNRQFRFAWWRSFIQSGGRLTDLVYRGEIPPQFTRMLAVRRYLPGAILMDTGPAALWGALCDEAVSGRRRKGVVLINIGNGHTVAALVKDLRMWGLFEHHTSCLNPEKLAGYLAQLLGGSISDARVRADGGHGAFIHPDWERRPGEFDFVAVTGPNRHMAGELGFHQAAPFGDMMLAGSFGLLAAAGFIKIR
ncbi:MAG: DUF1786 domain-containing protein [Firmicutes bacterium]|nr:DUF1786 domain-containing protein [Bacillota bacterium]